MDMLQSHCINECSEWILSNKYKQVGLEFPDYPQYLHSVTQQIKKKIGFEPIVFEDSNRCCSDCCIDERTAKPRGIEAIIHFGNTCLTPTIALPVLYVANSCLPFDSDKLMELLVKGSDGPKEEEDLILLYDFCCTPFIVSFYHRLKNYFRNLFFSTLVVPERAKLIFYEDSDSLSIEKLNMNDNNEKHLIINNRKINLPLNKDLNDYNFIYVRGKNPALESFQFRFSDKMFYVLDRVENTLSPSNLIKTVMGRSRKIEQVRDAKRIGILDTLVFNHKEITNRMKKLIKSANKKCYTFVFRKITEATIANIVSVDVFVYVSCPETALFDRNKDNFLYKNIVTPWELEVALNPSFEWTLKFERNFSELLNIKIAESEEDTEGNSPKETNHFTEREKDNTEIIEREPGTLAKMHENAAGEVLQSLSWRGLNPDNESSVPVGTVVEGRRGIAMQYDSEPK